MELKKTERVEVKLPADMPNKYIDETGVQWTYSRCFYCHMNCGIVIGADTMVVLDGKIFGKPRSASDGKHMLRQLSGRTHEVITAVSVWMVAAPNAEDVSLGFRTFADKSYVTFRDLTDEEITEYLRKGESFDKAGAYAIQGEGAALVDHYDGSLDTIIGLPTTRLIKEFPDLVNAEAAEC